MMPMWWLDGPCEEGKARVTFLLFTPCYSRNEAEEYAQELVDAMVQVARKRGMDFELLNVNQAIHAVLSWLLEDKERRELVKKMIEAREPLEAMGGDK